MDKATYDHNNDDSTSQSEDDKKDSNETQRTRIYYPKNPNLRGEDVQLLLGLRFVDKVQHKNAFEDYKIFNGFCIKITTTEKNRFQAIRFGDVCKKKLWASNCNNEQSF